MKEDILTHPPKVNHIEPMIELNADEFNLVVKTRRSVRIFKDRPLHEQKVKQALENGLLAPNSSNLQSWKFLWVTSEEGKKNCVEACLGQSAAKTAQNFIIAIDRTNQWQGIRNEMLKKLKKEEAPKGAIYYYEKLVPIVYNQGFLGILGPIKKMIIFFRGLTKATPRGPSSLSDMRVWAHKSCALACENIMLSLVSQGLDSCPMEGFDEVLVKKYFKEYFDAGDEVCMILGVGERAEGGIYGPQIRMDSKQFVVKV
jgi:nitroreductase